METLHHAVIWLDPPAGGYRWLLDKSLAGIAPLKRLVLTLGRAGAESIHIVSTGIEKEKRERWLAEFTDDVRLKKTLQWSDRASFPDEELASLKNGEHPLLMVSGNTVTTANTIRSFLNEAQTVMESAQVAVLDHAESGFIHLYPAGTWTPPNLDDGHKTPENPATVSLSQEDTFFATLKDGASFRRIESGFLQHHKRHYTQLLDVYFNCYFSIPISALLVKTPFTPNQLTLFGLVIGFAAGTLFAVGDYVSGLVGGILLAFTAIWDCCDGDVARLKFMESAFGEKLDTICDNVINIFIFTGIAIGVARNHGWDYALWPFVLLTIGGLTIFCLLYFPEGGKGSSFKETSAYEIILVLASRNFIYVILIFALFGKLDWFLWLAGGGSWVFAGYLFSEKKKYSIKSIN